MATIYVNDAATGSNNGSSWTDAYVSLSSVTPTSAGDVIYIASSHDEHITSDIVLDAGTASSPVWLVSATAGSSPVSYAKGATLRGIQYSVDIEAGTNDYVVFWGITQIADDNSGADLPLGRGNDSTHYYIDCEFTAKDRIYLGLSTDSFSKHTSCSYTINGTGGFRELYQAGTRSVADVRDGAVTNTAKSHAVRLEHGVGTTLRACDLSDFEFGALNTSTSNGGVASRFSGCEVGSGFAPATTAYSSKPSNFAQADYCATGSLAASDAVAGFAGSVDYYGQTEFESSRYRDDGARDSLSEERYCHKLTARYGTLADGHNSCELVARVASGGSVSVTMHFASAGTLYDDEIWMDLFGPSDTSSPRQHFATTRTANPTASRAAIATDSTSWTGSGVGTAQKITYTYTPHHPGLVHVIPVFAKASGTVYVCPKLTVV
tara:strand:+ start:13853 stop:15157 length:1305 start_codon:yes stop_codon:yes gene_type:complete